jgi:hypothetical protein
MTLRVNGDFDSGDIGSTHTVDAIGGRTKRKKSNRLLTWFISGLVAYVIIMSVIFTWVDSPTVDNLEAFDKTSVDNTPIFNLTEPHTKCQYIYDSVNKTITQAKGYESCALPSFN